MRAVLLILLLTSSSFAQNIPSYSKLKDAAVDILVNGNLSGSGAIISEDGEVLTAAHIFVKHAELEVVDHNNHRSPVKLIAIDRGHDLALLKIESQKKFPFLKISDKNISPGNQIFHFGSAFYRRGMMQNGFVSEDKPSFEFYSGNSSHSVRVMHISATMQLGTSGGPWVNRNGHIIGVQSGIMTIKNSNSGLAYLSPLEAIKKLLKEKKTAATPTFEITIESIWNQQAAIIANYPGYKNAVVIVAVRKSGTGDVCGLQKDDLIISFNKEKVNTEYELYTKLRAVKAGDTVDLLIYRPSEKKELTISVKTRSIEERFHSLFRR